MRWLIELKSNEIDKDWIGGIRKSWKKWVAGASKFEGRLEAAPDIDHEHFLKASAGANAYLEQGKRYVQLLREDLLFNKGFWTVPVADKFEGVRGKVIQLLADAQSAIGDGISRVEYWGYESHPTTGYRRAEIYADLASFNMALRSIPSVVDETAELADKIISGKLLRHLTSLLTPSIPGDKIGFDGYEPPQLKIGKITVIFHDTAADPAKKWPALADTRHPYSRSKFVEVLRNSQALLDRRKFGFLWYGVLNIHPRSEAPPNPNGAHYSTGAEYLRHNDEMKIYAEPVDIERLVIHELGHRYWFKFMKEPDRKRFESWFAQVPASSQYGSSNTIEDFAEVFADYVLGTDLSRDQVDRLKEFLRGTEKTERLADTVSRMRGLLISER